MLKDLESDDVVNSLRERAEAALRGGTAPLSGSPTAPDVQRLVYELEVHRVELELQNEELRQAQRLLAETHDSYRELYERAPFAYVRLDRATLVCEANASAALLLGAERARLLGRPLASLLDQAGADELHRHLLAVLATREKHCCELVLHGVGSQYERRVRVETVLLDAAADIECCFGSVLIDFGGCSEADISAPAAAVTSAGLASRTVLVVEDDTVALSALCELLRSEGYSVLCAGSPSEALALGRCASGIDVLLADMRLPEMSGDALAQALREQHPELRVIFMSGLPPPPGCEALFVQKPIDFDDLNALIAAA